MFRLFFKKMPHPHACSFKHGVTWMKAIEAKSYNVAH